ncbi:MAG: hypothetical protein IJP04_07800 [Clostridia bacterium]|nr:hypothetical protein [Clostridia bacterium]
MFIIIDSAHQGPEKSSPAFFICLPSCFAEEKWKKRLIRSQISIQETSNGNRQKSKGNKRVIDDIHRIQSPLFSKKASKNRRNPLNPPVEQPF